LIPVTTERPAPSGLFLSQFTEVLFEKEECSQMQAPLDLAVKIRPHIKKTSAPPQIAAIENPVSLPLSLSENTSGKGRACLAWG
jgi:hypothetical protein